MASRGPSETDRHPGAADAASPAALRVTSASSPVGRVPSIGWPGWIGPRSSSSSTRASTTRSSLSRSSSASHTVREANGEHSRTARANDLHAYLRLPVVICDGGERGLLESASAHAGSSGGRGHVGRFREYRHYDGRPCDSPQHARRPARGRRRRGCGQPRANKMISCPGPWEGHHGRPHRRHVAFRPPWRGDGAAAAGHRTDIWAEDAREQHCILFRSTDARGRRLRLARGGSGRHPRRSADRADTFIDSYVNWIVTNASVIAVQSGDSVKDAATKAAIAAASPAGPSGSSTSTSSTATAAAARTP